MFLSQVASAALPVAALTRVGAVATATFLTPHGWVTGDRVTFVGAVQPEYNVTAPVIVLSPLSASYTVGGTPATPATGAIIASAVTSPPVLLDEAKQQLRRWPATFADDTYVEDILIPAATQRAAIATRRTLTRTTFDLVLDTFPSRVIELPRPPLISVDAISYLDQVNVSQVVDVSTYGVVAPVGPYAKRGKVTRLYGALWPVPYPNANVVTIRYTAGYTALPPLLKIAILMDITSLYEQRGNFNIGHIISPIPEQSSRIYQSFKSYGRQRWVDRFEDEYAVA